MTKSKPVKKQNYIIVDYDESGDMFYLTKSGFAMTGKPLVYKTLAGANQAAIKSDSISGEPMYCHELGKTSYYFPTSVFGLQSWQAKR